MSPTAKKYKPCPPGSERNPTTHRCRKVAECPAGSARNASTGRCRKLKGSPSPKRRIVRRRKASSSYKFPFAGTTMSVEKEKYAFPFANASMSAPTKKAFNRRGRMQGHHKGKLHKHVPMPKRSSSSKKFFTPKKDANESFLAAYGL